MTGMAWWRSLISAVLTLDLVYGAAGVLLLVFGWLTFRDRSNPRRRGSALFWVILGVIFLGGSAIPHWLTGLLVLLMVLLDGTGRVARGVSKDEDESPAADAGKIGNRIFRPVIAIPLVTFLLALLFRWTGLDPNRGALVGLGLGSLVAMVIVLRLTRAPLAGLMREGQRLNESMGTAGILPQLLASLGAILAAAKVGEPIAAAIRYAIPGGADGSLFLMVLANCLGMTLLTIVLGNSFAAFPVIAGGVMIPLLIEPFGVDPALAAIMTLTAGSSGTLMTPMAANFNIVPAALLDLRDRYGVIRCQLPFALLIWSFHVVWLWAMIAW